MPIWSGYIRVAGYEEWDELDANVKLGSYDELDEWEARPKLFYRVASCDESCV